MPGYDYRTLNAPVVKAPASRVKILLESSKQSLIAPARKSISKLNRPTASKRKINVGYKLAMVQLRFGSLDDTSQIK